MGRYVYFILFAITTCFCRNHKFHNLHEHRLENVDVDSVDDEDDSLSLDGDDGLNSVRVRPPLKIVKRGSTHLASVECKFKLHKHQILKPKQSRSNGAIFIDKAKAFDADECQTRCCKVRNCTVGLFGGKNNAKMCYLFNCGSDQSLCVFGNNTAFTSAYITHGGGGSKSHSQSHGRHTTASPLPDSSEEMDLNGLPVLEISDECNVYQTQCANPGKGPKCVAKYDVCDGIKQCADGSDEKGCTAATQSASNEDSHQLQHPTKQSTSVESAESELASVEQNRRNRPLHHSGEQPSSESSDRERTPVHRGKHRTSEAHMKVDMDPVSLEEPPKIIHKHKTHAKSSVSTGRGHSNSFSGYSQHKGDDTETARVDLDRHRMISKQRNYMNMKNVYGLGGVRSRGHDHEPASADTHRKEPSASKENNRIHHHNHAFEAQERPESQHRATKYRHSDEGEHDSHKLREMVSTSAGEDPRFSSEYDDDAGYDARAEYRRREQIRRRLRMLKHYYANRDESEESSERHITGRRPGSLEHDYDDYGEPSNKRRGSTRPSASNYYIDDSNESSEERGGPGDYDRPTPSFSRHHSSAAAAAAAGSSSSKPTGLGKSSSHHHSSSQSSPSHPASKSKSHALSHSAEEKAETLSSAAPNPSSPSSGGKHSAPTTNPNSEPFEASPETFHGSAAYTGPIVALSLGLVLTLTALAFVACRLRRVRLRLKKGRVVNASDADYLINGMYL